MNRKEAFEVLNLEVKEAERVCFEDYYDDPETEQAVATFKRAVERLKQPLTIAEFLRWEEGVEYECSSGKYRVVDGELFHYWNITKDYEPVSVYLTPSNILNMRGAEKVEPVQKYRIPLPDLVTTDGKQQYLSERNGRWFASRLTSDLKQEWTEDELYRIPTAYRGYAMGV